MDTSLLVMYGIGSAHCAIARSYFGTMLLYECLRAGDSPK